MLKCWILMKLVNCYQMSETVCRDATVRIITLWLNVSLVCLSVWVLKHSCKCLKWSPGWTASNRVTAKGMLCDFKAGSYTAMQLLLPYLLEHWVPRKNFQSRRPAGWRGHLQARLAEPVSPQLPPSASQTREWRSPVPDATVLAFSSSLLWPGCHITGRGHPAVLCLNPWPTESTSRIKCLCHYIWGGLVSQQWVLRKQINNFIGKTLAWGSVWGKGMQRPWKTWGCA